MSKPLRISFLDASTVNAGDIDFGHLRALGELNLYDTTGAGQLRERIADTEVILTNKVELDADAISAAAADSLTLIVICATGVNNVDLDAARENGVAVCNVVGYSTASVAQHAITLLLNLATNVHRYAGEAPVWADSPIFTRLDYPSVELDGKVLGIAGAGNIGCRTGEIGAALGMSVQVLARPGSLTAKHPEWPRVEDDEFYTTSDAISLHCPLTDSTHQMINGTTLRQMKRGAFLINTGRGQLVDELALADALRSGRIGGAGLDVLSAEPPPADHPLLDPEIPNLLITPHTAWSPRASRWRLMDAVAHNIRSFLAGDPDNRVV